MMEHRQTPQRRPCRRAAAAPAAERLPPSLRKEIQQKQPESSNDSLWRLGRYIRELWIIEMREFLLRHTKRQSNYGERELTRWDGRDDGYGARPCTGLWTDLAKFCVQHELNPKDWVNTLFVSWSGTKRHPTPHDLKNSRTLQYYEERRPFFMTDCRLRLNSQKTMTARRLHELRTSCMGYTDEQAVRRVLLDEHLPLSPLFRFCIAMRQNLHDIANQFFPDALVQYAFDREKYDVIWATLIPGRLKQAAVELYAFIRKADGGRLDVDGYRGGRHA